MNESSKKRTRESRASIEKLYISMRQLFIRGSYKPNGVSGQSLVEALLTLSPEIYGSVNDPERVELEGLLYVIERLPDGIEECRYIKLVAREGFESLGYDVIIPPKRRRNCYRIDQNRMYIEMTRGRSDIYDILTHLTFLFIEANKIKKQALDPKGGETDDWKRLEEIVELENNNKYFDEKKAATYLSNVLGRTIQETTQALHSFDMSKSKHSLYHITYWLGKLAITENLENLDKEVTFSAKLREIIGHHIYGDQWANKVKQLIYEHGWVDRPVHIVSANLHSFMNAMYGFTALEEQASENLEELAAMTSRDENAAMRKKIKEFALKNGMYEIEDNSGTNLTVQVFDTARLPLTKLPASFRPKSEQLKNPPLIIVMDYAFGEQAYECMEELLKPNEAPQENFSLNVESVSIMGKAGILKGGKGDIMVPTAHVFEGTADNYPVVNDFSVKDFKGFGLKVFEGAMVTVLGTSLQNRDILHHFLTSTWNAIGIEMEGAHYQKAIQSATKIRKSIKEDIKVRYAYYASDNPLLTGSTLASGSLGMEGIKPTYLITSKILNKIFNG
ncbi:hypothetical protein AAG747_19725 [Rapidithrix thailandica]|uniref:Uncharacterized protein n=1 Tax=Rapidithrix thailandica TaxID=413964 RepID=A0AAW9SCT2_9BACT